MLTRRSLLQLASGLLLPVPEPVRVYSFVGGWAEPRWGWMPVLWQGLPVFSTIGNRGPLTIISDEPGEFLVPPDDRFRLGTYRELSMFPIIGRTALLMR